MDLLIGFAGAPTMTEGQAFRLFLEDVVPRVWGPDTTKYVSPHITLGVYEPAMFGARLPLAAIVHQGDAVVRFDVIYKRSRWYQLVLAERLLHLDEPSIVKILVHEAIHLGYQNHGQGFRDLCRKHGGAVSEYSLDAEGDALVKLEQKIGSRYRVIKTFPDEREATAYAKAQLILNPGERYRLTM